MKLQQRLAQFMQVHNVSQNQVAKGIGKSAAAVNQWLQGKYAGDNDALEQLIGAYLSREQGRLAVSRLAKQWVETATAKRMIGLLAAAHRDRENALLYGQAGMGKTTALRHYADEHPDVVLIEAMPTYTPAVVLKTIAKKLSLPVSGSLNDINEAILSRLTDSGRMIVVDEAENLSTKSLEILRRLHDNAEVGLVLAGMPRLRSNLMGRHGELAQLFSRVGYVLELPESMADKELAQICQHTLPELSEVLSNKMVQRANGSPRRLWKMMTIADRTSKETGDAINADMLEQLDKMLLKN